METFKLFKLKETFYKKLSGKTTKDLFYYDGGLYNKTNIVEKTIDEIIQLVIGKAVIFPIDARYKITLVESYIESGFTVYFMRSKDFSDFKKIYSEKY